MPDAIDQEWINEALRLVSEGQSLRAAADQVAETAGVDGTELQEFITTQHSVEFLEARQAGVEFLESQADAEQEATRAQERGDQNADGEVTQEEAAQTRLGQIAEGGITAEEQQEANDLLALLNQISAPPAEITALLGGKPLTPSEAEDAVDLYNSLSPTPVSSAQELFDLWMLGHSGLALEALTSIRAGQSSDWVQVSVASSDRLGSGRTFSVPRNHYEAFRSAFNGFELAQGTVFSAVQRNGKGVGSAASAYAGAVAMAGGFDPGAEGNDYGKWATGFQEEVNRQLTSAARAEARRRVRAELGRGAQPSQDEVDAVIDEWTENGFIDSFSRRLSRGLAIEAGVDRPTNQRAMNEQTVRRYDAFYRQFRNHGLALVALRNPKLAQSIYETGRLNNPTEAQVVQQAFLDAGYSEQQWAAQGDAFDGYMWSSLLNDAIGDGAAGRGDQVIDVDLPDRTALDESMRTLYRSWFRREPSAEELAAFSGEINGAVMSNAQKQANARSAALAAYNPFRDGPRTSDPNVSINQLEGISVEGRLADRARRSEEYRRLYGRKPEGIGEEQYVGLFENRAQQFAPGSLVGDEAIRAGMETGNTQTTIGRLFSDRQTWQDNSTFLGRLSEAARIVARMT